MTDLSGTWLGTYWQRGKPTRFEATLVQGGNTLTGNTLDDSYLGEACLSGSVIGRQVQFAKRYLLQKQMPVHYQGTVSEEGNTMQGTWDFGSLDSGRWEAHRQGESLTLSLQKHLTART
ncbi:MAG: hypothetical protein ACAF41_12365 [Leptolyngbya sp. BL-A-14]